MAATICISVLCELLVLIPKYFCRRPAMYEVQSIPSKLPPLKQPVPVTSLPMLGYLEQTAATAVINSLSTVGAMKPKFPFLSSTSSALVFVSYHLKGKITDIVAAIIVWYSLNYCQVFTINSYYL